jgi:hypothetical protein
MEYFYGGGGNNNPDFTYRFLCKEITNEMWKWCENYPLTGPFERWHIKRNGDPRNDNVDRKEIPMIQFESRQAAYWFRLAYSEYIIADKTYSFAKDWHEKS